MFNSSIKSEFVNILALDNVGENHQFPSSCEYRGRALGLPKLDIEGSVHLLNPAEALLDAGSHGYDFNCYEESYG